MNAQYEEFLTGEYNNEDFMEHILERSCAEHYKVAVKEWDYIYNTQDESPTHCPCGHGITERCYIKNRVTGETTFVGNVCVEKFMGIDNKKIVAGVKRITEDNTRNANKALIDHADKQGYLFDGDRDFLMKRKNRKHENLDTTTERVIKKNINNRIINRTVVKQ